MTPATSTTKLLISKAREIFKQNVNSFVVFCGIYFKPSKMIMCVFEEKITVAEGCIALNKTAGNFGTFRLVEIQI